MLYVGRHVSALPDACGQQSVIVQRILEYGLALCAAYAWGLHVVVRRVSVYCIFEGVRCVGLRSVRSRIRRKGVSLCVNPASHGESFFG